MRWRPFISLGLLLSSLTACFDTGFVSSVFDELSSIRVQRRPLPCATNGPCPTPTPSLSPTIRALASASPTALRSGPATVVGNVRDATTMEPIESAFVQIEDCYVLTDKTGFFRIEQLENGPTKITVTKEGFRSFSDTLTLTPAKQVEDVLLTRLNTVQVNKQTTQIETTTTVTQSGPFTAP